jgi:beta-glucosidase
VEKRGLDHYDRFVDALLDRGVQPVVTLFHWDLPQWLQDRGGWAHRDTSARFAEYASVAGERLGDRVHLWATQNESWVTAVAGYLYGLLAPGIADGALAAAAHHHLLLGHGLAVQALRAAGVTGGVGVVNAETLMEPADDRPETAVAVRRAEDYWGRGFRAPLWGGGYPEHLASAYGHELPVRAGDLETIAAPLDWIGVNNYNRELVAAADTPLGFERIRGPLPRTEMDWEITPHSLAGVLRYYKDEHPDLPPIYVTENGMADTLEPVDGVVADTARIEFLAGYIGAMADVIDEGVDIRGYFVWSLMDNFEWAFGYRPRFGLVHVDHATGHRTVKDSARWYAELAAEVRGRRPA